MTSPDAIVYVFHGSDEPTLRDQLGKFIALYSDDPATDMNLSKFDGSAAALGDIENAASALPFLSEHRVVIVENLTTHPQAKEIVPEVADLITRLPDWARVTFVETGTHKQPGDSLSDQKKKGSRRKLLKKLINAIENDSRGSAFSFNIPDNDIQRVRWIKKRASHHQAEIEAPAAELLAERVGQDLTLLDNELLKLATYTNGKRAIKKKDVALLTPYEPEVNIFPLVDAIGLRNGKVALEKLRRLLRDDNQSPLQVYAMIIRQYRLMIQVKEQLSRGHSPDSIAKIVGLHPYVAKKMSGQSHQYSIKLLERIYEILLEIDLDIKTGVQKNHQLALETLIARLSK